jgi:putative nucleotidyltransferase with HDIG domain
MAKDTLRASRGRTDDLRREIEASASAWQARLTSRAVLSLLGVWALVVAVVGTAAVLTGLRPLVAEGRVARETRIALAPFEVVDAAATEQERSAARARTPRVYTVVPGVLDEVRNGLENLPRTVAGVESLEQVEPTIRAQWGLTEGALEALREQARGGEPTASWQSRVTRLHYLLTRSPIVARETFQLEAGGLNREVELIIAPGPEGRDVALVPTGNVLNVDSPRLGDELRAIAVGAGFGGALADVVVARLGTQPKPTFVFDAALTDERQPAAADRTPGRTVRYPAGEVLIRRGDVISAAQVQLLGEAIRQERLVRRASPAPEAADALTRVMRSDAGVWIKRGAVVAGVGLIVCAMAGYTALFVPRIRRNPARSAAVGGLVALLTCVSCYATVGQPELIAVTALFPPVLLAFILCIAYGQRVALALGSLQGLLVCVALNLPAGVFVVMVLGVGAAVWALREIRERDALIRAGVAVGAALLCGAVVFNIVDLPRSAAAVRQALWDGVLAGFCGLVVAGLTLFILPTLERAFGIMTGMTLVELRDPKQPLLRQLQQRAPGTYNHSLNLAALGEAAAESVGADGLLTYVGALYHDIGKMNKPDYFVENQAPGFNRHDRLTPAMSLLVIVGHVKDGLELAREFNLPRPLWHFIESHHGTTLVEYFYQRARRQAEAAVLAAGPGALVPGAEPGPAPTELEYRYPGPRPRTREAAIIMLCDAVESASRTLADPTPGRIEALVRAIATKRLLDGQFDDCDLTLRELNTIAETVSRSLASIYHGRIAYPGTPTPAVAQSSPQGLPSEGASPAGGAASPGPSSLPATAVIAPSRPGAGVPALATPLRPRESNPAVPPARA